MPTNAGCALTRKEYQCRASTGPSSTVMLAFFTAQIQAGLFTNRLTRGNDSS